MDTTIQRGASAESDAVRLLLALGYRIVARNFRCRFGELDIIARDDDGDVLVFVEVRSRGDTVHGDAVAAIGPRKQAQVARVAAFYLDAVKPVFTECRFDVVAITAGAPVVIKDAFRVAVRSAPRR